ncbi:MAG: SPOR domain-containing protein, partial [Nitrospinota bacterium]
IVRLEPETPAPRPGEGVPPPADPQFYKALTTPARPAQEAVLDPIRLPDAKGRDVGRVPLLEPKKETPAQAAPQPSPAIPPGPPREESQEAIPYPRGEGPPRYTIQVLSVQEADRAEHVLRELLSQGIPAFIEQAHLGDKGVWHRVRVGRFWDRGAAERTLQELRRKAGRGGSIISP